MGSKFSQGRTLLAKAGREGYLNAGYCLCVNNCFLSICTEEAKRVREFCAFANSGKFKCPAGQGLSHTCHGGRALCSLGFQCFNLI